MLSMHSAMFAEVPNVQARDVPDDVHRQLRVQLAS
jgi:hypothetical protein